MLGEDRQGALERKMALLLYRDSRICPVSRCSAISEAPSCKGYGLSEVHLSGSFPHRDRSHVITRYARAQLRTSTVLK